MPLPMDPRQMRNHRPSSVNHPFSRPPSNDEAEDGNTRASNNSGSDDNSLIGSFRRFLAQKLNVPESEVQLRHLDAHMQAPRFEVHGNTEDPQLGHGNSGVDGANSFNSSTPARQQRVVVMPSRAPELFSHANAPTPLSASAIEVVDLAPPKDVKLRDRWNAMVDEEVADMIVRANRRTIGDNLVRLHLDLDTLDDNNYNGTVHEATHFERDCK